ncbi:MAG: TetR family transcriptional regulator, partial [Gammaproteobacteria bacterium]
AMVVGLFTDWTRDTELFAPQVDTKALIDPLFRGLVRDWPEDPDQPAA